jgi:hypothetical protein
MGGRIQPQLWAQAHFVLAQRGDPPPNSDMLMALQIEALNER